MSIVTQWIRQKKSMGFKYKVGALSTILNFLIRLILDFVFRYHHASCGADVSLKKTSIRAGVIDPGSRLQDDRFNV